MSEVKALFDLTDHSLRAENARALNAAILARLDAGYRADDPGVALLQEEMARQLMGEA